MNAATAKLQREWYARLRDEGFDDIEYGREDGPLKVACRENRGLDVLEYESTLAYFGLATDFLYGWEWPNPEQREAWRLHTEGATVREIASARGKSPKWAHVLITGLRVAMMAWRGDQGRRAPKTERRGAQLSLPF